jgi:hypothetical protein
MRRAVDLVSTGLACRIKCAKPMACGFKCVESCKASGQVIAVAAATPCGRCGNHAVKDWQARQS